MAGVRVLPTRAGLWNRARPSPAGFPLFPSFRKKNILVVPSRTLDPAKTQPMDDWTMKLFPRLLFLLSLVVLSGCSKRPDGVESTRVSRSGGLPSEEGLDEGTKITLKYLKDKLPPVEKAFRTVYSAVPEKAADSLPLAKKFPETPKNIVLIIGDGMGQGAYDFASSWTHGRRDSLFMQQLPHGGLITTHPGGTNLNAVTDSAAAGTALATGTKVRNGHIAQAGDVPGSGELVSSASVAAATGRHVAVLTSDYLHGATPASFYAHSPSRKDALRIVSCIPDCGFEILSANDTTAEYFHTNDEARVTLENAGYELTWNDEDLIAAVGAGKKVLGHVPTSLYQKDEEKLGDILSAVLERFASDGKGFFVMLESSYPDWGGHSNNPELTVNGTLSADWAVYRAVQFASKRDDTLVIVTADHETGGVCSALLPRRVSNSPEILYTSWSHTGAPVPIFAYGPGAEKFDGVNDNTHVGLTCKEFLRK